MVAETYLRAVDVERNDSYEKEAFSKKKLTGPGCKRDVGRNVWGFKDNAQVAATNHKKKSLISP